MHIKLAEALLPPDNGKDPSRWRWKVWATLMAIIAVGSFHIAAVKNMIPGVDGVAHAADIESIDRRLTALEEKQNVALRLQLAAEICRVYRLRAESSSPTRSILDSSLERLQEDYAEVNRGRRYSILECERRLE